MKQLFHETPKIVGKGSTNERYELEEVILYTAVYHPAYCCLLSCTTIYDSVLPLLYHPQLNCTTHVVPRLPVPRVCLKSWSNGSYAVWKLYKT